MLETLLDSWDRNNTIVVNLLRAIPQDALGLRATPTGPSIAQMFTHIHYVRLIFIVEAAPDVGAEAPKVEWLAERDPERLAQMLNDSAKVVRETLRRRLEDGRNMDRHYDHPIMFLQHMVWHEGYHHGQIKLALKIAGRAFDDEEIGGVTWDVWIDKTSTRRRD